MSPEERARIFAAANPDLDAVRPPVALRIQALIEAVERDTVERCAAICDRVQAEGDEENRRSADPGAGCDGAGRAAELIREGK